MTFSFDKKRSDGQRHVHFAPRLDAGFYRKAAILCWNRQHHGRLKGGLATANKQMFHFGCQKSVFFARRLFVTKLLCDENRSKGAFGIPHRGLFRGMGDHPVMPQETNRTELHRAFNMLTAACVHPWFPDGYEPGNHNSITEFYLEREGKGGLAAAHGSLPLMPVTSPARQAPLTCLPGTG
ncbi:hypothetical protein A7E75_08830 [Syntrophotalea acetylenica]|uniref:Uncharacterized protein n=1 Tax=Syntrophotalea acetylenica TaxID=29542 RepID=A0A1L3GGM7_SYNAC|nr:hypothetical protein A7E75_08830 [Syntrophotalea acetylenica]APG43180.1 hypothetical protein A6070_02805 [Syntrophotalea acetylenica]